MTAAIQAWTTRGFSPADLAAENADLRQQLECLEAVALELIAERDRAVATLELQQQLSLLAEPA